MASTFARKIIPAAVRYGCGYSAENLRAYEALRRGDAAAAGFFALLLAAVFVLVRLLLFAEAAFAVLVLAAVLRAGAFFGVAAFAGAALVAAALAAGALAAPVASGL